MERHRQPDREWRRAGRYFRGINQPMQTLLDPTNVSNDAMYVKNYFHRWATVCSIPAANVVLGDYIVQVKTNSQPRRSHGVRAARSRRGRAPTDRRDDRQLDHRRRLQPLLDAGRLRHELGRHRQRPDGTGVSISATTNLPIYANAGSDTTPTFYLARITPTAGSGRTLLLNLYDLGDVGNGSVDVHVVPPADATVRLLQLHDQRRQRQPRDLHVSDLHHHRHDQRGVQRTFGDGVDPDPAGLLV